jgi:hypothetical protein
MVSLVSCRVVSGVYEQSTYKPALRREVFVVILLD